MNKSDLIEKIAADAEISKAQAQKVLESFLDATSEALTNGDKVILTGYGTFSVENRDARTGRNPQTGKSIEIPAKKVVKFTPGKALKDSVQG